MTIRPIPRSAGPLPPTAKKSRVVTPFGEGHVRFSSYTRAKPSVVVTFRDFTFEGVKFSELSVTLHQRKNGHWAAYEAFLMRGGRYIHPDGGDSRERGRRRRMIPLVVTAVNVWWSTYGIELQRESLRQEIRDVSEIVDSLRVELDGELEILGELQAKLEALNPEITEGSSVLEEMLGLSC